MSDLELDEKLKGILDVHRLSGDIDYMTVGAIAQIHKAFREAGHLPYFEHIRILHRHIQEIEHFIDEVLRQVTEINSEHVSPQEKL